MKKTIALAAAAVIGLAAWAARAQPYAPTPPDNLLFTQAQTPNGAPAAKAKTAAKTKSKSDAKAKAAAKSKKGDPKKTSKKKKTAKKKAAPPPS